MTKQEILKTAIQKAIDGGFDISSNDELSLNEFVEALLEGNKYYQIIYLHTFAKALWGERDIDSPFDMEGLATLPAVEVRLMQMVIADDPITYLKENI